MEKVSKDHTVEFNSDRIITTVTNDSWKVEVVLHELQVSLATTVDRVVGFDIKHKSNRSDNNSTIATLQLCHGTCCLVIQLPRLGSIPNSLERFGVGKIIDEVSDPPNRNRNRYSNLELSELAAEILGVVIIKPVCVAQSDWSSE
ncbi:uncharacterized protein LOC113280179 [Papaver somniferum]|uniref:uncharacterized protein LOC113280179 n=1 Tax=Papaver somniferum TaxID=3469 RepID=UPI000E6F64DD|nr:uncharacterized protein LOC113280179 [Papaver somniferum]